MAWVRLESGDWRWSPRDEGWSARAALRAAAVLLLVGAAVLTAAVVWIRLTAPSPGGRIQAVAVDATSPDVVYAAGEKGLHRSTDGGRTWTRLSVERPSGWLVDPAFGALATDPSRPSLVYASGSAGVYVSTDAGTRWRRTLEGEASVLAAVPGRPGHVVASQAVSAPRQGWALVRSTDGGATWAPAGSGLGTLDALGALAASPSRPGTLYLGRGHPWGSEGGVFVSSDGARSWRGLAGFPAEGAVMSLAVDPYHPLTILAGTNEGSVVRSRDGGRTWSVASRATPPGCWQSRASVDALAFDPRRENAVYAGSWCGLSASTDGGRTWKAVDTGEGLPPHITSLAVGRRATRLFAATTAGRVILIDLPLSVARSSELTPPVLEA